MTDMPVNMFSGNKIATELNLALKKLNPQYLQYKIFKNLWLDKHDII